MVHYRTLPAGDTAIVIEFGRKASIVALMPWCFALDERLEG